MTEDRSMKWSLPQETENIIMILTLLTALFSALRQKNFRVVPEIARKLPRAAPQTIQQMIQQGKIRVAVRMLPRAMEVRMIRADRVHKIPRHKIIRARPDRTAMQM